MTDSNEPHSIARVRTPWRRRATEIARGPVQLLLWLTIGAIGIWLAGSRPQVGLYSGLARHDRVEVRSIGEGRVTALLIEEGDLVARGAPIALLDDAAHLAELATAQREVAALAAEVDAAAARHAVIAAERVLAIRERELRLAETRRRTDSDAVANRERREDRLVRLAVELRRLRLESASTQAAIVGTRLELTRVERRRERASFLASNGVDRRASAIDLDLEVAALEGRIEASEALLAANRALIAANERDLASARASSTSAFTSPENLTVSAQEALDSEAATADAAELVLLERRIAVARARFDEIKVAGRTLELVSPIAGRVTRIWQTAGTSVLAGDPVVTIESDTAKDIVIYLDERALADVLPDQLIIARAADPLSEATVDVKHVSGVVEPLPETLWRLPQVPEFGLAMFVDIPVELALHPGERLRARPALRNGLPR